MLSVSTAQYSSSWTPAQAQRAMLARSQTCLQLHSCAVASVAVTLYKPKGIVLHSGMSYKQSLNNLSAGEPYLKTNR